MSEKLWRDKYPIYVCGCGWEASIKCLDEKCRATSCNGGGCEKCSEDFGAFNNEILLTQEEKAIE